MSAVNLMVAESSSMSASMLAQEIEAAERPSRRLDAQIATFAGWQRKVIQLNDSDRIGVLWLYPGETVSRLPAFTESLDAAIELVAVILPASTYAVSWFKVGERTEFKAAFEGSGDSIAATPAMALCAAALRCREKYNEVV